MVMKPQILYIQAIQKNLNVKLSKKEINKLPKKLFLAYTIQYKNLADFIKKQLKASKIKIEKFQQVLGCSKINTKIPVLLISTGRFHTENLILQAPEVYILENNKIIKTSEEEIRRLKSRKKTALIKFLSAEKIGILVSTKPGQENLKKAVKLKEKLRKEGKKSYIFLSNNIDVNQFENFNIDSWLNTACPALALDHPAIINYQDLL